jgi:hypothetical protein
MLTAMTAVDNILGDVREKDTVWSINTGKEYHEETNATHGFLPGDIVSSGQGCPGGQKIR